MGARAGRRGRSTTSSTPARPFVYFPLHVTDDYKITRIIPHCADQASLVEQVADALPPGYDLVLKEHPMSVGRNSFALLRRLRRAAERPARPADTSSHDLIRGSAAVAVICSTVGLEALLYDKPVLTLGQPFYAGFGVTLDVDSFARDPERVPELLALPARSRDGSAASSTPRCAHCHPGAPVLVDRSEENAVAAGRLDRGSGRARRSRRGRPLRRA